MNHLAERKSHIIEFFEDQLGSEPRSLNVSRSFKRLVDICIALLAGVLLLPVLVVVALAVKLTSRGPVVFGHERIGKHNTRFRVWKFRTMVQDAERKLEEYLQANPEMRLEWEQEHKLKDDPRITRIGKFMRKWSLDELPQLWNVLRGEMTLVGPRPIVAQEIARYKEHFATRCSVPPGITGLWQVSGRNNIGYDERVELDMYYIRNWSPWLDFYLIAKTVRVVLCPKGAY